MVKETAQIRVTVETKKQLEALRLTNEQTMDEVIQILIAGKVGEMQRLKKEIYSLTARIPAFFKRLGFRLFGFRSRGIDVESVRFPSENQ